MILTQDQQKTMLESARPLIKWMNKNCHPHCTAIVDCINIEIVEGVCKTGTEEYLRD